MTTGYVECEIDEVHVSREIEDNDVICDAVRNAICTVPQLVVTAQGMVFRWERDGPSSSSKPPGKPGRA